MNRQSVEEEIGDRRKRDREEVSKRGAQLRVCMYVCVCAGSGGLSARAAAEARRMLERERAELLNKTGMAEEERDSARQELQKKEAELEKAR